MAWTEFYMDSAGSNLNAGSTSATSATSTTTNGNWDATTGIFIAASGTPFAATNIGDWASVYPDANSTTPFVGQVTAVTSNTQITVSLTTKFGTAPTTSATARSCKIGGAWANLGMTASGVALNTGTVTQATRINVKAGTYANTTTIRTLGLAGATTTPIWWRGYKTNPGDQDTNANATAGTDIPTFTWGAANLVVSGGAQIFSNIDISGANQAGTAGQVRITGAQVLFYRCRSTCTGTSAANSSAWAVGTGGSGAVFIGCYGQSNAAAEVWTAANPMSLIGCVAKAGLNGYNFGGQPCSAFFCVSSGAAGDGFKQTGPTYTAIVNCSVYNAVNGVEFTSAMNSGWCLVANLHLENCTGTGIKNSSGTNTSAIRCLSNSYYNCLANRSGLVEDWTIWDDGTLGGSGFNAPGSDDYTATTTLKAIGFPGVLEKLNITGYLDNGALQRQEPAGGGSIIIGGEF